MCLGGQCSRSRPGLYAYAPDNNRVRGAATSQTRLCSLLLLLPPAILLLQRWWTAAASNRTLKPRAGWNHGGCWGEGGRSEVNFAKKILKRHLEGMNWHFFLWPRRAKIDSDNTLYFCSARFLFCRSLGGIRLTWWFVELVSMDSSEEDVHGRGRRKGKTTEKVMTDDDDDEDNDGVIDVLTPYQVHSAPVSSQQAAELTYKMFSAPRSVVRSTRLFVLFFFFISFTNLSGGCLP